MYRIIFIGLVYGSILFIAFLYREPLLLWLNQSSLAQLPIMFLLAILFSTIPIVPFTVFAGLMGAKYFVWIGAAINWTGSVGAAVIFFVLARYFFVEQFQKYISKYDKVQKFDRIISQNAFIAILFTRMIPIIPTPVVNIYSGISSMLFRQYIAATALGQIPGMIVYAYLGNQLFTSLWAFFMGILIYVGFILLVIPIYRRWNKAG
ncbi:TVP38/TMEM64 family protein [Ornithinibacillus sp. L9]|uniref:TVP38/TMEM64 family membrane protein n=1 Tax=Ornithinibacillus caprae TaxID=2678566 RepID=A0A6N8FJJ7_9BACI|nr:TVP38/TMEM64 family protein [Ornithinibacillus caprae]